MKKNYPKSFSNFKNNADFYEEIALLNAQETIAELMQERGIKKIDLAKSLNKSKSHITEMLSDGRNLTLRSFARICFYLNAELNFKVDKITCGEGTNEKRGNNNKNSLLRRREKTGPFK